MHTGRAFGRGRQKAHGSQWLGPARRAFLDKGGAPSEGLLLTVRSEGLGPSGRPRPPGPIITAGGVTFGLVHHAFGLRNERFPAELDLAALLVDADALDHDLLAFVQLVRGVGDTVVGDLADVQQAVQAGQDGDEGAELDHLGDLAQVGLANLSGLDEVADHFEGDGQLLLGGAGDLAEAVVVDVHFAAADLDDAADGGAALADDVADLLLGELDAVHLGGIAGVFGARHGQHLAHEAQQVQTASLGLVEGLGEDLGGDAADLDVHLQGGDAPLGAGDLEVHVAVVVFLAGDVGQHHELVAVADEAHGHAGHGGLELDAGIHQGKGTAADGGH